MLIYPGMIHETYYRGYDEAARQLSDELLETCQTPNGGIVEFVTPEGEQLSFVCKEEPDII